MASRWASQAPPRGQLQLEERHPHLAEDARLDHVGIKDVVPVEEVGGVVDRHAGGAGRVDGPQDQLQQVCGSRGGAGVVWVVVAQSPGGLGGWGAAAAAVRGAGSSRVPP